MIRITVIWLLLVAATILSFGAESVFDRGEGATYSVIAILVISLIKVRFVILDFMELRTAPLVARLINELWVLALGAVLIRMFWVF